MFRRRKRRRRKRLMRLNAPDGELRPVIQWPVRPLPQVGRELAVYKAPNTRLTRLAMGRSRLGLLVAGLACLIGGVWPGMWTGEEKQ